MPYDFVAALPARRTDQLDRHPAPNLLPGSRTAVGQQRHSGPRGGGLARSRGEVDGCPGIRRRFALVARPVSLPGSFYHVGWTGAAKTRDCHRRLILCPSGAAGSAASRFLLCFETNAKEGG